ncbi:MAG: substrate-binding domain-containing protein [Planctomycetota bacterium]
MARGAICVVVAGACIFFVYVAIGAGGFGEPWVDLEAGAREVERSSRGRDSSLRFAVASMVSAEETFSKYRQLVRTIGRRVGREDAFILRPSYADVRRELEAGRIDIAFVCTGTYVHSQADGKVELLVRPEFEGGAEYRSLLIVPALSPCRVLEDLRGKTMALTDPESNTGCLVPYAILLDGGLDPKRFFGKTVFTGSHDRSIQAVARGLVDVAAVDSLIWNSKLREDPPLAGKVRILLQSEPFGAPPILVPGGLEADLREALRKALVGLHEDEEGRKMLSAMGIARFVPARKEEYSTAVEMYRRVQSSGGVAWR